MKLLHTADWHVGKVLKGYSRHDEHVAVLAEIVQLAADERVDVVLVAGDVFESAAPTAESQRLAYATLVDLRRTGAEVIVLAGNHDHSDAFDAVRPVFASAGITVLGRPARPDSGGVLDLTVRSGGRLTLGLLPFVSQRGIVKAEALMDLDAAEAAGLYAERMRSLVARLSEGFAPDAVNVLMAHAYVRGGRLGGGERDAQTVHDYGVDALSFPPSCSYVALGHLHRHQVIPGACPIWYPGSPLAVDFGEEADAKGVLLVEAEPGVPVQVRFRPLTAARRLLTVEGTLADLVERSPDWTDALLRVVVDEPARAGLADDVRAALPNALDVRLRTVEPDGRRGATDDQRLDRGPHELFASFLAEQHLDDPRLAALFAELLDEELST